MCARACVRECVLVSLPLSFDSMNELMRTFSEQDNVESPRRDCYTAGGMSQPGCPIDCWFGTYALCAQRRDCGSLEQHFNKSIKTLVICC